MKLVNRCGDFAQEGFNLGAEHGDIFGIKIDAVPVRLNETWFQAEREGIYYGQCSELCGTNHGFMPIAVEAVTKEAYDAWVSEAQTKFAKVEGFDVAGQRVLVVEDTSTTGASPLTAVRAVREAGGEVVGVATVVDRATGAAEIIEAEGLPYRSVLGLADLGLPGA